MAFISIRLSSRFRALSTCLPLLRRRQLTPAFHVIVVVIFLSFRFSSVGVDSRPANASRSLKTSDEASDSLAARWPPSELAFHDANSIKQSSNFSSETLFPRAAKRHHASLSNSSLAAATRNNATQLATGHKRVGKSPFHQFKQTNDTSRNARKRFTRIVARVHDRLRLSAHAKRSDATLINHTRAIISMKGNVTLASSLRLKNRKVRSVSETGTLPSSLSSYPLSSSILPWSRTPTSFSPTQVHQGRILGIRCA